MKKKYLIAGLVVIGLGISGFAFAQAATGQLSACVKKNGEARFVISGYTKHDDCKNEERKVSWGTSVSESQSPRLKNGDGADLGELIGTFRDGGNVLVYVTYFEPENAVLTIASGVEDGSQNQYSHGTIEFDCLGRPYYTGSADASKPNNQSVFLGETVGTLNDKTYALTDDLKSVSVDCPALSGYVAREVHVPAIVSPVRIKND